VNLANRITIARILLMPVVVFFVLVPWPMFSIPMSGHVLAGHDLIAAIAFIVATATDGIDGYIARSRNMITNFGKFMDPLADKLLVCAVIVALVARAMVPAWIAIVIISREFAVTGLRMIGADEGIVIAAGSLGKWKTRLQVVAIAAVLLDNFPFAYIGIPFDVIALYAATIMTIVSGIDYFIKNRNVLLSTH
jgi:CDP-diacylglycerol--glycerol-3-phosphate 3-phosphatidyltransferase